jgi:hypothetical protein
MHCTLYLGLHDADVYIYNTNKKKYHNYCARYQGLQDAGVGVIDSLVKLKRCEIRGVDKLLKSVGHSHGVALETPDVAFLKAPAGA